ncbi:TetR/AcrR family transcriptional regulator [Polluticoccus soli]|uniref:TetR/AcrR family transcriptional regulator n=1 Tax=Polluticoccus soli TaxID=3034150 RepID=UPI0023E1DA89|nr:TetR/AcrR family transcriptional regulator [Flavipsychrobacter sp. JY13-12]
MEPLIKILSASAELFRQYGFKAITMDDIARRAGISKKTLYQHFANKHEVVNESVTWYKCRVAEGCQAAIDSSENAIDAMLRTQMLLDQTYKQMNPMALLEMQRFFPEAYELFRNKLMEDDVKMIRDNIEQGIREGLYREGINADFLARYRLETSLIMFQPNLLVNERYDLMFVTHEICEHFLYGIMTTKGEKYYHKYKDKYLKQVSK